MAERTSFPLRRWRALNYDPQRWATDKLHARTERFKTLTTARQVGKTTAAAALIDEMLHTDPWDLAQRGPAHLGILGPTYSKARMSVELFLEKAQQAYGTSYVKTNMNDHRLWIPETGAKLQWLSADDPKSVVGYTFSDTITDESQDISDLVIDKFWPTLGIRKASLTSFGTPDITPEQTWFKSNYIRGQDEEWEDYWSANVTAYENKFMAIEDIIIAKNTLSDREFRMLYLGEWVDEEGGVFPGFSKAVLPEGTPDYGEPKPNVIYVIGLDLAIYEDFNVAIVGEKNTRTAIAIERWHQQDLFQTYDRIEELSRKWNNAAIHADESGIGIPMVRELRGRGLRVTGTKITSANKMEMVSQLNSDMEHRRIQFPAWKALIRELKAFVYHATPSGKLTANAAAGYHDDTIWALIFLMKAMRSGRGTGRGYNYIEQQGRDRVDRSRMIMV
jgi:hypothetical protein